MKFIATALAFLAAFTTLSGFAGSSATAAGLSKLVEGQSGDERGYPKTTVLWPRNAPIPVCWGMDEAFAHYAADREIVRQAVANTWEAASLVRFAGWGRCGDANNNGISIGLVDDLIRGNFEDNPRTFGLGTDLVNLRPGMLLNFEFSTWTHSCQLERAECIRKIAVHEFGHALGFAHEQNRNDTPKNLCLGEGQGPMGSNGDVLFGPWDLASIMNYCNPQWIGDGNLSAGDIAMVRKYYGGSDTFNIIGSFYILLD